MARSTGIRTLRNIPAKVAPPTPEIQEGAGSRSPARDERTKRTLEREPQREEPRIDSVEPGEMP